MGLHRIYGSDGKMMEFTTHPYRPSSRITLDGKIVTVAEAKDWFNKFANFVNKEEWKMEEFKIGDEVEVESYGVWHRTEVAAISPITIVRYWGKSDVGVNFLVEVGKRHIRRYVPTVEDAADALCATVERDLVFCSECNRSIGDAVRAYKAAKELKC